MEVEREWRWRRCGADAMEGGGPMEVEMMEVEARM